VRGGDDGAPGRRRPPKLGDDECGAGGIEVRGGLVGEHQRRLEDERSGEGAALLLTEGHLSRTALAEIADAEGVQAGGGDRTRFAPRGVVEHRGQRDVLGE
jgi:hypothetical protein